MDNVLNTLSEINSAWRDMRFEVLSDFFDENIVMKGPGLKDLVHGRDALVQSYVQFMTQSIVIDYVESNHSAHTWGDTATVAYDWTMTYEQKGETKRDAGQDMFVFVARHSEWIAVLRLMLF